jgi:hypothetical protein
VHEVVDGLLAIQVERREASEREYIHVAPQHLLVLSKLVAVLRIEAVRDRIAHSVELLDNVAGPGRDRLEVVYQSQLAQQIQVVQDVVGAARRPGCTA